MTGFSTDLGNKLEPSCLYDCRPLPSPRFPLLGKENFRFADVILKPECAVDHPSNASRINFLRKICPVKCFNKPKSEERAKKGSKGEFHTNISPLSPRDSLIDRIKINGRANGIGIIKYRPRLTNSTRVTREEMNELVSPFFLIKNVRTSS